MANFAAKAIPIIGAAIDVISNIVENVSAAERSRKFEKNKDGIKNEINKVFIECIEQLKDDSWYFDTFAPRVKTLEEQVLADERDIAKMEDMKNKYMAWSKRVKDIECSIL